MSAWVEAVQYSVPERVRAVMSAIRRCPDHGVFDAGVEETASNTGNARNAGHPGNCPVCGAEGTVVLDGGRRVRLSKFLSGVLRHFPEDVDVTLTECGWAAYDRIVAVASDRYPWADRETVDAVVATDPKGRFERERRGETEDENGSEKREGDERIRAAYGHSIDVSLETDADDRTGSIPERLYHGTAPRNRESISSDGLRPMNRREVHLSATLEEARAVGARHATEPIVFAVDAQGLVESGHEVTERGRGVYTTDRVPPRFLAEGGRTGTGAERRDQLDGEGSDKKAKDGPDGSE